jgi:hypothetical protein
LARPFASLQEVPRRVVNSARSGRLSSRSLYYEPFKSTRRSALVVGSARSGTTKLAELLSSAGSTRLIYEPGTTFAPPTFTPTQFVASSEPRPDMQRLWADCLRGKLRARQMDNMNHARVVHHRIVKSVWSTNLTGWLRAHFPEVPIGYIVRHPFAVATSVAQLDVDTRRERGTTEWAHHTEPITDPYLDRLRVLDGPLASRADAIRALSRRAIEPFDRAVIRWCLQNAMTLLQPPAGVRIVYFEQIFSHADTELPGLAHHLSVPLSPDVLEHLARPSGSDYRSYPDRRIEARIGNWVTDLSPQRRDAGLEILECFGLGSFYDAGPLPSGPHSVDQEPPAAT